jgi:RNA polymerase sigma-70 factor (ECF subfamily)
MLLKQRHQSSFSYLYDNYSSALYTVILNVVKDETIAADTLQEVFVKIWKQIESYDDSKGRLLLG